MMNELVNSASVSGLYNNLKTELESNETSTELITGNLEIVKSANKEVWTRGYLAFTIIVSNPTSVSMSNYIVRDILDPQLIRLVTDSVRINNVPAGFGNFTYNEDTGELVVSLANINANQDIEIDFLVSKRGREIFRLENTAELTTSQSLLRSINATSIITSNTVVVIGLSDLCACNELKNRNC